MPFEMDGLDSFLRKIRQLQKNAEEIRGEHSIPESELFTPAFMRANTKVTNFDELVSAGGFSNATPEDFKAIPDDEWEKCVIAHTRFQSWAEMQEAAGAEWVRLHLEKDI